MHTISRPKVCMEGPAQTATMADRGRTMQPTEFTRDFSFLPPHARRHAEEHYRITGKDMLSMQEASSFLGISHSTMYRYAKNGTIPSIRITTYHKFDLSALALLKSGEKIQYTQVEEQEKKGRGRPPKVKASPADLLKTLAA